MLTTCIWERAIICYACHRGDFVSLLNIPWVIKSHLRCGRCIVMRPSATGLQQHPRERYAAAAQHYRQQQAIPNPRHAIQMPYHLVHPLQSRH